MKQKVVLFCLKLMPCWILNLFERRICTFYQGSVYEQILIQRFYKYLEEHFDDVVSRIKRKNRFMIIEKGQYPYHHFNVYYLNNMIALMAWNICLLLSYSRTAKDWSQAGAAERILR